MSLPREGVTVDYFGTLVRKTLLNHLLTVPAAVGVASAALPNSLVNSAWARRLKLARPFVYGATAISVALKLNEILNRGCNNNWTKDPTWNWDDEIVLITGGCSGIGARLAQLLLARNPRTRIVIVDYAPLSWTPAEDAHVDYYQCDLSDSSQLRATCARIREEVGHPTVLVNNAGVCRGFTVRDGSHSDVEFTIRTNLTAPFLMAREFLPEMVRRDHGHIVNMGSMSSLMPPSRMADYAATKAGLAALHEALQLELKNVHAAPRVRLTLGVFSFIRTPLFTGETNQSKFLFPLLEAESVAEAIAKALYSGYGRTIYMPGIMPFLAIFVNQTLVSPHPIPPCESVVLMLTPPPKIQRGGPEWLWRLMREGTHGIGVDFRGRQKIDPDTGALLGPGRN